MGGRPSRWSSASGAACALFLLHSSSYLWRFSPPRSPWRSRSGRPRGGRRSVFASAHILFGKPASTFPGYALAEVLLEELDRQRECAVGFRFRISLGA